MSIGTLVLICLLVREDIDNPLQRRVSVGLL